MILLSGRRGGTTHRAVELLASLPTELRLIGGLAVLCRVGSPHRSTVDLDAVARGLPSLHEQIARLALTAPGGGQYTFADNFDLDVIDVAPDSSAEVIAELTRGGEPLDDLELNVVAHTWAYETATPLDLVAVEDHTGAVLARAEDRLVATPAGLIAMKATTVPLRASSRPEKRASDFYDLGRLLVDGGLTRGDADSMPAELHDTVAQRLGHWFTEPAGRDRVYRETRRFDEPRLDLDDAAEAAQALFGATPGEQSLDDTLRALDELRGPWPA
ncbi:MAG: nucleotidyl transferase AbiEii/AbiGii toxin family protein [Actinobacteria bacterium]|nr:nucleotidyl transferase AbiEii/AbiGii toxin family protein [Actinomycetota bacterium]